VLGQYNYQRIDSWTEFGLRYQLAAIKVADYPLFDAARLKPGLWYFLLQPPDFRASFPFFFLNPDAVRGMPAEYQVDRVAGVFASMPFFGFLFGLPFGTQKMKILLGPLAATGAVLMLVMASIFAPIERYLADFCTLWLLCALAVWFWLSSKHRAFAFTGAALLSYSAAFGAAISFLGYSDKPSMPFVAPLRPDLQLNVDFAGIEPGLGEPLVVTGKPGAADFLFVRPAGPRHVTFHLDHWGRAETSGPPVPIEPGRAHLVNIRLDAGVIVEMDGREVFRDSIELYSYTDVYVGVNPLGGTTCKARFGGKISQ
jgi:hypothetical protein